MIVLMNSISIQIILTHSLENKHDTIHVQLIISIEMKYILMFNNERQRSSHHSHKGNINTTGPTYNTQNWQGFHMMYL